MTRIIHFFSRRLSIRTRWGIKDILQDNLEKCVDPRKTNSFLFRRLQRIKNYMSRFHTKNHLCSLFDLFPTCSTSWDLITLIMERKVASNSLRSIKLTTCFVQAQLTDNKSNFRKKKKNQLHPGTIQRQGKYSPNAVCCNLHFLETQHSYCYW